MPPSLALPEREHALAARNGDWGNRHHHKGSVQSASCSVGPHYGTILHSPAPISGGSAPNISPERQAALEAPCHIVGNRGAVIGCGVRAALDWGLGLQGLGSGSWGRAQGEPGQGLLGCVLCCDLGWFGLVWVRMGHQARSALPVCLCESFTGRYVPGNINAAASLRSGLCVTGFLYLDS